MKLHFKNSYIKQIYLLFHEKHSNIKHIYLLLTSALKDKMILMKVEMILWSEMGQVQRDKDSVTSFTCEMEHGQE